MAEGGRTTVTIPRETHDTLEFVDLMMHICEWLETHCDQLVGTWKFEALGSLIPRGANFHFTNQGDAALFRLRWG